MNPLAWAAVAVAGLTGWLLLRKKSPKTLSPPSHAALVGDSLAVGLAKPLAKELAPAELVTRAHVGSRASDWLAGGKYRQDLVDVLWQKPDVVLISLGTNDSAGGGTGFAKHFEEVADRVRGSGAVPIFLGPPELPWPRGEVHAAAEAAGFLVKAPAGLAHALDGVHLTPQGYADWAKYVGNKLRGGVSDVGSVYDW